MPNCKNHKNKILLINPPLRSLVYSGTLIQAVIPQNPPLNLASIATPLLGAGQEVKIFDLDVLSPLLPLETLIRQELDNFRPNFVGITVNTPAYLITKEITRLVKGFDQRIKVVVGGVHPTVLPREVLDNKDIDVVVLGEGDFTLQELVDYYPKLEKVAGIAYKKEGGQIVFTQPRNLIGDLDQLPYPAWRLFNLEKYQDSKLNSRRRPSGLIETSRGCPYSCRFCNKIIFGKNFRSKSVKRVVNEMEYMLNEGFGEIHVIDDGFSIDLRRAEDICDEIIERRLNFPWTLMNGIRVDRINEVLFLKLKRAGCYRVAFGIESGNQDILNKVGKGVTLDQVEKAVKMAKRFGLETPGFFILGFPEEVEADIQKTINFSKKIGLDFAKYNFLVPYPGTPVFEQLKKEGRLKLTNWENFRTHFAPEDIYDHPNVSWPLLKRYYKKAYRVFYFRPGFIAKRIFKGILSGTIFSDVRYFYQTKWR